MRMRPPKATGRDEKSRLDPRAGLIELLVVIVIIGVLTALLLPAIAGARKRTREAAQRAYSTALTNSSTSTNTVPAGSMDASTNRVSGTVTVSPLSDPFVDPATLAVILAGALATVAWSYRRAMSQLQLHAELAIHEVLSDGEPRSRQTLADETKSLCWPVRIIPGAFTDALASLVAKERVTVMNRQFHRISGATQAPGPRAEEPEEDGEQLAGG